MRLLVLLFGSFLQPITILLVAAAVVRRRDDGAAASRHKAVDAGLIGMLMLMGIVTKNAIMLVDFAVEEMRDGMPRAKLWSRRAASARGRSS